MRFRCNEYHSYLAKARIDAFGKGFVRIIDRYYPGPPGPEYTTVLNLGPHEAYDLGKQLIASADAAKSMQIADEQRREIEKNTAAIAAAARAEAESVQRQSKSVGAVAKPHLVL